MLNVEPTLGASSVVTPSQVKETEYSFVSITTLLVRVDYTLKVKS
jgi:hypothetical protein